MKKLILLAFAGFLCVAQSHAQQLQKPIMETPEEDWDTCSFGKVANLNPDGDNFLAVRAGPGTDHAMIDKIHDGENVWIFNLEGPWLGIVYGAEGIDCPPVTAPREYQGPGKKGWVFEKYIQQIAG
ncbi:MAG: SH3 domain-containing protein [Pseudomonadota bacterium]